MTAQEKLGRNVLLILFIVMGSITALLAARGLAIGDFVPLVRLLTTLALFYAVWIGQVWAGWLLVILLFIGALVGVVAALAAPIIGIPLVVFYLGAAVLLMAYRPIASFLDYQSERRAA